MVVRLYIGRKYTRRKKEKTTLHSVCSRFYQWHQWYTDIVQGSTNGTIGNTIGTNGNANGTIGPPNGYHW